MIFKLQATAIKVLWVNDSRDSFLYSVQETIINYKTSQPHTKSWAIWSREELIIGHSYDIEGYISESPDNKFKNDAGKVAYKANYNATKCDDLTDFDYPKCDDFGPVPSFDDSEIPF